MPFRKSTLNPAHLDHKPKYLEYFHSVRHFAVVHFQRTRWQEQNSIH